MIMKIEKVMNSESFRSIRTAYIARSRLESGRITSTRQMMDNLGFEQLDAPPEAILTPDGREILHAHGKAWALKPEVHANRLAEAVEQAKQRDATKEAPPQRTQNTCTTLIDGQLCGGSFTVSPVCPKCALGKQGVTATLTCDVCGHVTAIMAGTNS